MTDHVKPLSQLSSEQLLDELARRDERESSDNLDAHAGSDSTLKNLKAELDTLASQLSVPRPVVPFEQESDCRRVTVLVEAIGAEPSPAGHAGGQPSAIEAGPLGELGQYRLLAKLGEGTRMHADHLGARVQPSRRSRRTHRCADFLAHLRGYRSDRR